MRDHHETRRTSGRRGRRWRRAVACVAMIAAGGFALAACGSSGDEQAASSGSGELNVGVIEMLTGSSGFYGKALLKGAEVAAEELNDKGGIGGDKIKLLVEDNASDDAQTVNLVRKFGQDDSIPAIIAPTYQPNMEAGCAIANSLGLVQIAGQSAPPPEQVNRQGLCFTNAANIDKQVQDTIAFVAEKYSAKRFAQIYDQKNAYQSTFNKVGHEYIVKSGLEIPVDEGVDTGLTDYGPLITGLLKAAPDAVIVNLTTEDAARFMQQARARGLKSLFVGANASQVNVRLYELSGGAADGFLVSTSQSEAQQRYADFVKAFEKMHGKIEDPISGFGYDAMVILGQAIEKAGSHDREKVKAAMESIDKICASICYTKASDGTFVAEEIFFEKLTKNGFVSVE